MPNLPVRGLGAGGIILDPDPQALALNCWTGGRNVCFTDGKARRSPVWKTVEDGMGANLRYLATLKLQNGYQQIIGCNDDGSLNLYRAGVITSASETAFKPFNAAAAPWTSGQSGNVSYINNPGRVPRVLLPGSSTYEVLPAWDPTWRCQVMRDFNDQMVALGVSKGTNSYPTMVKISGIMYDGAVPASWDATDDTTLNYENVLADLDGPIIDGLALTGNFLLYTPREVWEMSAGGEFNFAFRQLFTNLGIAAANCVVEVGGVHYVFGPNDLYMTDGNSFRSLTEGKVRKYLAATLDFSKLGRCFVQYDAATTEVFFCYASTDPDAFWTGPTGCNMAAVYNLTSTTWSFVDLPNVTHLTKVNASTFPVWQTDTSQWTTSTRTWASMAPPNLEHLVAAQQPGAEPAIGGTGRLLAYDWATNGILSAPQTTDSMADSYVLRTGMGFDGPDGGYAPLRGSKRIRSVFPVSTIQNGETLGVTMGSQYSPQEAVVWDPQQTPFDPATDDRIDVGTEGRYIAIRFDFPGDADGEVSGFDLDMSSNGGR